MLDELKKGENYPGNFLQKFMLENEKKNILILSKDKAYFSVSMFNTTSYTVIDTYEASYLQTQARPPFSSSGEVVRVYHVEKATK